ncbi:DUF1826 domain-containing protein [Corallococcus sp. ZKHCc1 1396]|uniref:DUF1826 domain-containing protein n=1 Tax=Corallococcus soli TaxID=2710757 RepID=A0ABR9PFW1_9BACT|nr:DUF1826 domain-containing protein [Corallococcus soli]MBE4746806.1 DUF1826 domain-containing protein [Corallococcus soli]
MSARALKPREVPESRGDAHAFVWEPAGLTDIYREDVNLCVWRRGLDARLSAWLGGVGRKHRLQVVERVDAHALDLRASLASVPESAEREAWLQDLHAVVGLYADLFEARWLGVRLTTVDRDLCPRFHVDRVGVRLLCTYAGPATEWLEECHVARGHLGPTGEVLRPGGQVRTLERFDVALLKGEAWPGNEGRGAVHRSPSLTKEGSRRILLTVDVL